MCKSKDIKIVVHKPTPENESKFATTLSTELVKLIEVLMTKPKQTSNGLYSPKAGNAADTSALV